MTDSYRVSDGEGLHALDENQQHRRGDGYGVVDPGSGACLVSPNTQTLGQPDTLSVASGDVLVDGTVHSLAQQDVGLDAANSTDPRRDVVYVDTAGSVQVAKGAAESAEPTDQGLSRFEFFRPAPPDLSGTAGTVLAEIWVPAGASSVGSDDVRDRRLRALGPHSFDEDIATQSELDAHAANASVHHAKYTDEGAQDAVGTILGSQFTYDDATPAITLNQGGGSSLNADQVDGYEGADLGALAEAETVSATWAFSSGLELLDDTSVFWGSDSDFETKYFSTGDQLVVVDSAVNTLIQYNKGGPVNCPNGVQKAGSDVVAQGDLGTELALSGDTVNIKERVHWDPGHVEILDGDTDVEYQRIVPPSGGTVTIDMIGLFQQGGGSSTSVDMDIYDVGAATELASVDLGSADRTGWSAAQGNTVIVRFTNSSGSDIAAAAPKVKGYIA